MRTVGVSGLWKTFGRKPEAAQEMAREGVSRQDIQTETGCLVAVRDISFEVNQGETFVVMGLSGSGKSTLVRCMSRLVEPTEGRVEICGTDLTAADASELRELRRRKIAMVFQHFALFPHRRVIDNVAYGLEVQGVGKNRAPGAGAPTAGNRGAGRLERPLSPAAQRRYAAAGGAGPRACRGSRGAVLRRAVLGARSAHPPGDAGRVHLPAGEAAAHPDLHHPRLRRGPEAGGPHRHHARRRVRPGRDARSDTHRAG